MSSPEATIYCPSPDCQAPNPESHRFCQQCRAKLPKYYLWGVGKGMETCRSGELLENRYLVKHTQVILDTQPGKVPAAPAELPPAVEPYLHLSPYCLQVPQVYGVTRSSRRNSPILLLEHAPLYPETQTGKYPAGTLIPDLATVWEQSTGFRQLHWLWQIASLWQPLWAEGVATTLFNSGLLRTEGSLLRLLELQTDGRSTPTLAELGKLWRHWQPTAKPEIANFMDSLCQSLQTGQLATIEQLVTALDHALCIGSQSQSRQLHLVTRTDQGPTRQRNEDACYPPSGTIATLSLQANSGSNTSLTSLVIVCDGIGGHEGGNVASSLAIATVQERLQPLLQSANLVESAILTAELAKSATAANDVIVARNDNENRQERQRMGTTLVASLAQGHELYLLHVGDSRAYRISHTNCHQVTLDDDLAAREARLGYSLYREALQHSGSGSLTQALGMNASSLLHPTVQRFVLDEDCLFLLCSDGLSDFDRVEQHWETELLPILDNTVDLEAASQRLIDLANQHNGHDNVTVGLVHCRVIPNSSAPIPIPTSLVTDRIPPKPLTNTAQPSPDARTRIAKPVAISPPHRARPPLPLVLASLLALGMLGGVLAYWLGTQLTLQTTSLPSSLEPSVTPPIATPTPTTSLSPSSDPKPKAALITGSLVQVNQANSASPEAVPLTLLLDPPGQSPATTATPPAVVGTLPPGTILRILPDRQKRPNQNHWHKLQVCSVPSSQTKVALPVRPGMEGWADATTLLANTSGQLNLKPDQLGVCTSTNR